MITRNKIKDLLADRNFGKQVTVMGWVRTFRNNRFVALSDGSCMQTIQIVLDYENLPDTLLKRIMKNHTTCLDNAASILRQKGFSQ